MTLTRSTPFAAALLLILAALPVAAFQAGPQSHPKVWPIPNQKVQEFQYAVTAGWLEKMVKMATEDPSLINSRAREGQSPLTLALTSWSRLGPAEATWLIEHGADINPEGGAMGSSPLMLAYRYPEVFKLMLDRGADVEATDGLGRTALDLALEFRGGTSFNPDSEKARDAAIKMLMARGAKLSFTAAIRLPDLELVRKYLTDDPSLIHKRSTSPYGSQTPLGLAVIARRENREKYQPVVDLISARILEPTACEAAMMGRTDLLAADLEMTPIKDINKENRREYGLLDCALIAGERGVTQYLLNKGVAPDMMSFREAMYTDADTMRLVLSFGAVKGTKPETWEAFAKQAEALGKKDVAEVLRAQK